MGKWKKEFNKIRNNPSSAEMKMLCGILERIGFVGTQRGSHITYRHKLHGRLTIPLTTKAPITYAIDVLNMIENNDLEGEL